jgi:hypothetical protein
MVTVCSAVAIDGMIAKPIPNTDANPKTDTVKRFITTGGYQFFGFDGYKYRHVLDGCQQRQNGG